MLAIPAWLPATTPSEFVAYVRKNPSTSNYGTLETNSPSHLLGVRLQRAAGLQWQDIAYKGYSPAIQAVMSGEIQAYFTTQGSAMTLRDSDKVRLIATASERRSIFVPEVPTFKEAGLDGVCGQQLVLQKLREVSSKIMGEAAMKSQQEQMGLPASSQSIEQFARSLPREFQSRTEEIRAIESSKSGGCAGLSGRDGPRGRRYFQAASPTFSART